MIIYGTAVLAGCLVVGTILGDALPAELRRPYVEERPNPTAIAKRFGIARSSGYGFLPAPERQARA